MNINQLPSDILIIIIDEMNDNIFPISLVNKEFHNLSRERILKEKEKYKRKNAFFKRCNHINFYWDAFNKVVDQEECDFLREKFTKQFGLDAFIPRVRYRIGYTLQIPTEIWHLYLKIHDPPI